MAGIIEAVAAWKPEECTLAAAFEFMRRIDVGPNSMLGKEILQKTAAVTEWLDDEVVRLSFNDGYEVTFRPH